jgi:uncharacterized protein (UPF0332 family)
MLTFSSSIERNRSIWVESKDEYMQYRFNRAKETFEEALILRYSEKWNAVINRLYYSCFYAVIALLIGQVENFLKEIEVHL